MRAYWAAKYESLVRDAALADSMRAMRSHLEPLRVLPEKCLPADSLFPGHIAAHDANRPAEPNRLMSTPISEMITSAVRRLTQGWCRGGQSPGRKGRSSSLHRCSVAQRIHRYT